MATRKFWFPSQTGSFYTPAGNLRIEIQHTIGGGTSYNHDLDIIPVEVGELEFPFEVEPSTQTMRFPSIKIKLPNINNILESPNPIIDKTNQKYQTFITIIKDGTDLWWGIIDYDTLVYEDWYLDGATWKYRYLTFTSYDRLAYIWWNKKTMGYFGTWGSYNNFKTKIEDALALTGETTVTWDTTMKMTEEDGVIYDYNEWEFSNLLLTSSTLISQWIKDCMIMMGLWIYNWDNTWRVIRRIGGPNKTISTADLVEEIVKSEDSRPIEYIKISSTKNWSHVIAGFSSDTTYTKEYGDSTAPTNRQFIITDPNRLLHDLEVEYDGTMAAQFGATGYDDADYTFVEDLTDMDNYNDDIETGIVFTFQDSDSSVYSSIIIEVPTLHKVSFYSRGVMPDKTKSWIMGTSPVQSRLWKLCRMIRDVAEIYNTYFLNSTENYKFILRGIANYIDFHSTFTFNSLSLKVKNIKVNILEDKIIFLMKRIA